MVLVDPFQEEFVDWLKAHQPENYEQFVNRGRQAYVSDWEATLSELRNASSFPGMPVALLSASNRKPQKGDALEQGIGSTEFAAGSEAIINAHAMWLSKIPTGKLVKVEGSSHNIPDERPEVVVQAIVEIIQQINNSKR
jgi:pimeloyl-ACP methyl ester carboxylesterase